MEPIGVLCSCVRKKLQTITHLRLVCSPHSDSGNFIYLRGTTTFLCSIHVFSHIRTLEHMNTGSWQNGLPTQEVRSSDTT